jgi:hypothetical protein
MTRRADALFDLTEALLCTDGPVKTLVGSSLAPEYRRGHGAMYDALNHGRIDVDLLRRQLVGLPLPRAADGRLVLAVDVSPWLRPNGNGSPQRSFCHTYGRGKDEHRHTSDRPITRRAPSPAELVERQAERGATSGHPAPGSGPAIRRAAEGYPAVAAAAARPATRPEKRQPPRNVPSRDR